MLSHLKSRTPALRWFSLFSSIFTFSEWNLAFTLSSIIFYLAHYELILSIHIHKKKRFLPIQWLGRSLHKSGRRKSPKYHPWSDHSTLVTDSQKCHVTIYITKKNHSTTEIWKWFLMEKQVRNVKLIFFLSKRFDFWKEWKIITIIISIVSKCY